MTMSGMMSILSMIIYGTFDPIGSAVFIKQLFWGVEVSKYTLRSLHFTDDLHAYRVQGVGVQGVVVEHPHFSVHPKKRIIPLGVYDAKKTNI